MSIAQAPEEGRRFQPGYFHCKKHNFLGIEGQYCEACVRDYVQTRWPFEEHIEWGNPAADDLEDDKD